MRRFEDFPEAVPEKAVELSNRIEEAIEIVIAMLEPTEEVLDCFDAYWGWASKSQVRELIEDLLYWRRRAEQEEEVHGKCDKSCLDPTPPPAGPL